MSSTLNEIYGRLVNTALCSMSQLVSQQCILNHLNKCTDFGCTGPQVTDEYTVTTYASVYARLSGIGT